MQLIKEVHTSKVARKFGVGKIVANLQRYVYWPKIKKHVARFIRECIICCSRKSSNRKQGLHRPLPVPTHPWESIYMEFVRGSPTSRKGLDYLFVVVNRFSKMCANCM